MQFLAVFDDRGEAWSDAEARLVAPFATACKWSEHPTWLPALALPYDELDELDELDEPDEQDEFAEQESDDDAPADAADTAD